MTLKLSLTTACCVPVLVGALAACADVTPVVPPPAPVVGAVYSMSNARAGNEIVAFGRTSDGMLSRLGAFPTGGTGSGSFEDVANALILGTARGESSPNNNIERSELLFAANPGSNSIAVFRVVPTGLSRVEVEPSGGEKPVSLTVSNGVLYALHSGETEDDLFDANGDVIAPNCTTGARPSITGFTVTPGGQLAPIPGSTRSLSGDGFSGCAQVSFTPDGTRIVVTERTAVMPGMVNDEKPAGDEGVILTYAVNADGTLGTKRIFDATGQGPFGFTFTKSGLLLASEQFDGPKGEFLGAASAYAFDASGGLIPTSASVGNGGTDSCWFVVTDDGTYGYVASFFDPSPRIASYRVSPTGGLQLLDGDAAVTEQGTADLALSGDSRYLYNINAFTGELSAYRIEADGGLTAIQVVPAHPASDMAATFGLAAY